MAGLELEACPLRTALRHSLAERAGAPVSELRAYKLGVRRWSYAPISLTLRRAEDGSSGGSGNSQGPVTAAVSQALPQQRPGDHQDGEGAAAVVYTAQLTSGHALTCKVYLCHSEPAEAGSGEEGGGGTERFAWRLITRQQCVKGCQGPVLRPIQRFGRVGKRQAAKAAAAAAAGQAEAESTSSAGNKKDPRHMWLSLDEACSHVGATAFRLVAGIYDASGAKLLSTAVSPPIRSIANNDMTKGTTLIPLEAELPADWEGWQAPGAAGAAAGAAATASGSRKRPASSRKQGSLPPAPVATSAAAAAVPAAAAAAERGQPEWERAGGKRVHLQHAASDAVSMASGSAPLAAAALGSAAAAAAMALAAAPQAPDHAQHAQPSDGQLHGASHELARLDSLLRVASSLADYQAASLSTGQFSATQPQRAAAPAAATGAAAHHDTSQLHDSDAIAAAPLPGLALLPTSDWGGSGAGLGLHANLLAALVASQAAALPATRPPASFQAAFPAAAALLPAAAAAAAATQPEVALASALQQALRPVQSQAAWLPQYQHQQGP